MPELPEVETVRQTLKNLIIGEKITDILVRYDGIIKPLSIAQFKKRLIGQSFRDIRRKAKYLFFDFDSLTMVSHLRMEGKYYLRNSLKECTKHEHVIFELNHSQYLCYHDVRKFGTMELTDLHQELAIPSVSALGKEGNDPTWLAEDFFEKIKFTKRPMKSILLDQHIISGLGNIYVDETLFRSKINPNTLGNEINLYQAKRVIKSAKEVLNKATNLGGTTIRTYHSNIGVDGRFQNELMVHTFVGEPCRICGDTIQKTKVGGRGTYYCPTCQRDDHLLIVGLTGGIASGKSFVSNWFSKHKVPVLDADKIYKNLLKTNEIMYNEIVQNFGDIVQRNHEIDRQALGKIIFQDPKKRELLNQITHPFVLEEMKQEIAQYQKKRTKMIILDIPLLFEAKLEYMVDIIMLAYVDPNTQIHRLMDRDQISKSEAEKKIQSQMKLEEKIKKADIIIDNSFDPNHTKEQLLEIYRTLRRK
ncbi:MAG: DNA-formamidopyrimidine glycosylase [Bacilli bacterium]|nr:DNA-formamidopyrimidine glycosylase [Bacilli bacterium]MBN2877762.1 DNA-formamidopyrimidine glycosylase [Bacilli bacterium]